MRTVISRILPALFLTLATSALFGQAAPGSKIVIVDTAAFFNEKTGITRIVAASKTLNTELSGRRAEVQQIVTRIEAVNKELETFRANAAKGIPFDERLFQTKADEFERLKREGKYKEDDFNAFAQKRQSELVGPAYSDAMRVLGEYVKSKDYGIIFDASKDQTGMLIYASEKFDITRDFVAFYNARPATTIAPVPR